MSILENNKKLKDLAGQIKVNPPDDSWNRIENLLLAKKKRNKSKLRARIKNYLSIAASICIIVACVTFIYSESAGPQKIHKVEFVSLEQLQISEDYFYSVSNARNNNKLRETSEGVSSFIDLNSLKGTSLLPIVFRD